VEMMGLRVFIHGDLEWLPGLKYTYFHEMNAPMHYNAASFTLYFTVSLLISLRFKSYGEAVNNAVRYDIEHRSVYSRADHYISFRSFGIIVWD